MADAPITFTLAQMWAYLLALAGAIVALAAAGGQLAKLFERIRKPNTEQNKRLDAHDKTLADYEKRLKCCEEQKSRLDTCELKIKEHESKNERYDQFFANDKLRLDTIDESTRVTQKALLALLSHAIDGNNTKQLEDAKVSLQDFLISR